MRGSTVVLVVPKFTSTSEFQLKILILMLHTGDQSISTGYICMHRLNYQGCWYRQHIASYLPTQVSPSPL